MGHFLQVRWAATLSDFAPRCRSSCDLSIPGTGTPRGSIQEAPYFPQRTEFVGVDSTREHGRQRGHNATSRASLCSRNDYSLLAYSSRLRSAVLREAGRPPGPSGVVCLKTLTGRRCSSLVLRTRRAAHPARRSSAISHVRLGSVAARSLTYSHFFSLPLDQKAVRTQRTCRYTPPSHSNIAPCTNFHISFPSNPWYHPA